LKAKEINENGSGLFKSLYEILSPGPGFFKGSNTWVIHGNHTKSGKPILAGDVNNIYYFILFFFVLAAFG